MGPLVDGAASVSWRPCVMRWSLDDRRMRGYAFLLAVFLLWLWVNGRLGGGGSGLRGMAAYVVCYLAVFVFSVSFHEYAHAYVAWRAGDHTPRFQGRLTLNPFAHLDLFGTIAFFLVGIGWARPVPVNPYNFKDRRIGELAVSLAGPMANVTLALCASALLRMLAAVGTFPPALLYAALSPARGASYWPGSLLVFLAAGVLVNMIYINVLLAVFNLLPIPPLDGSHLLKEVLPPGGRRWYEENEWALSAIGVVALLMGVGGTVLRFLTMPVLRALLPG